MVKSRIELKFMVIPRTKSYTFKVWLILFQKQPTENKILAALSTLRRCEIPLII